MRARRHRLSEFQIGALVIVLTALFVLLAFTKVNPFSNPYELKAGFRDARNIGVGSPVRIAGVEVGRVSKLEPSGDGAATVTMELRDDALPIHRDVTLKIRPRILLEGNYFVDVRPGTPGAEALDDGSTVPVTQTATSVSLPDVVATLTTDTRTDLQSLLQEYGSKGLANGGAQALNRSIPYFAPAYRRTAITNDALLGTQPNRDLRRLLRGQARTFGALAARPEQLKDLVRDLDSVASALASQDSALAASVPALRDTLRVGYPVLADVDAALPSLRRFSIEALPGVESTAPMLGVAIPWIAQARALVSPQELRGLSADLRRAVPGLVRLNNRLVPLNAQLRALSSCTSSVLVPFAESEIPSIEANNANQQVRRQIFRSFVGLAGESRVQDANSQVFHVQGVIPSNLATGRIEPAAPLDPGTPPVHRPDVPCETQDPPVLAAPGGPAAAYSAVTP
ncbi:MAG: MCE family protein [Thermoleophilaceae bacterium]|nr:MCE family protein [Thermoleophilaceae bacterium]